MDSEQGLQNSSTLDREDLELIDIDSLFDDVVLCQDLVQVKMRFSSS